MPKLPAWLITLIVAYVVAVLVVNRTIPGRAQDK
jgi:hypothetical protein